jgi:gas vesicle protein
MSDNTGSKMFFSFLTGAALGAGLALLFAPQSGKETRKQIKDLSDKLSSEVKDEAEKIGSKVKYEVDRIGEKARNVIDDAKETFGRKSRI